MDVLQSLVLVVDTRDGRRDLRLRLGDNWRCREVLRRMMGAKFVQFYVAMLSAAQPILLKHARSPPRTRTLRSVIERYAVR